MMQVWLSEGFFTDRATRKERRAISHENSNKKKTNWKVFKLHKWWWESISGPAWAWRKLDVDLDCWLNDSVLTYVAHYGNLEYAVSLSDRMAPMSNKDFSLLDLLAE